MLGSNKASPWCAVFCMQLFDGASLGSSSVCEIALFQELEGSQANSLTTSPSSVSE